MRFKPLEIIGMMALAVVFAQGIGWYRSRQERKKGIGCPWCMGSGKSDSKVDGQVMHCTWCGGRGYYPLEMSKPPKV